MRLAQPQAGLEIPVVDDEQVAALQSPGGPGEPLVQLEADLEPAAHLEAGRRPPRCSVKGGRRERAQHLDEPVAVEADTDLPRIPVAGDLEDVDRKGVEDLVGQDAPAHRGSPAEFRGPLGPCGGGPEPAALPPGHAVEQLDEPPSQGTGHRPGVLHGSGCQIAEPGAHLDDPEWVRPSEVLPHAAQRPADQPAEPGADRR